VLHTRVCSTEFECVRPRLHVRAHWLVQSDAAARKHVWAAKDRRLLRLGVCLGQGIGPPEEGSTTPTSSSSSRSESTSQFTALALNKPSSSSSSSSFVSFE